ncbi:hypothetical protein [Haloarcula marina]|uniref:hypothetical protein n=1 Tax=Haloarcula marina TaxID=2961574 RepID=UPI0020B648EA|nr:hypothetical protein [Halomicroarcula marina]
MDEKFSGLPKKLCLEYQRLAREIDYRQGAKFFESLVLYGGLEKRELKREAFYTYDIHHECNILLERLSELSEKAPEEQAQKIRELADEIASEYVDHPITPTRIGADTDR